MKNLQENNLGAVKAFDHESIGVSWYNNIRIPEYLGAFHTHNVNEVAQIQNILKDAVRIFEKICGYKPTHFIAPNMEPIIELDRSLAKEGVLVQTMSKLRKYPKNNDKFGFEFNWMGRKNKESQIIVTRNCGFEPSDPLHSSWVDSCLKEINIAFKFRKPAVISTHRVNYIGSISEKNAENSYKELNILLSQMVEKWPDIEFMTSTELGIEILTSKIVTI